MGSDPTHTPEGRDEGQRPTTEDVVARYVDRLNAGERLTPEAILAEEPDLGERIIEHLEAFLDLDVVPSDPAGLGTLGDYTLRRRIGRGGMGVVYEAWENSMDRRVALKVLPPGIAADDRAVHRFLREARAAGKLSHPGVVPVYATGIKDQTPYYAMEYVDGETLARVLARVKAVEAGATTAFGRRDDARYFLNLADAFADVADGLQHAHSKGVIHRDIKPSNLILDSGTRLRILDFGLARLQGQESFTRTGDCLGTPLYMSPEQALQRKIEVDHRTDIYSLGATLYEAIAGSPPFVGKDHHDTLSQIVSREPVSPRKLNARVPKELETIVLKCLRKDPGERYGTAEALAQDLRRLVRGDPIEAKPLSMPEVWARRLWRHRVRAALAGSIAVSAILAVVLAASGLRAASARRWASYVRAVEDSVMDIEYGRFARPRSGQQSLAIVRPEAFLVASQGRPGESGGNTALGAAIRRLEQAAYLFPHRPEAAYQKARALYYLGRDPEARATLEALLRTAPAFAPARALLGTIERRSDPAWPPVPAGTPADPWDRAYDALDRGEWPTVDAALTELLRSDEPGAAGSVGCRLELVFGRGLARLASGRWLAAAEDMASVVERWPESVAARVILGHAYLMLPGVSASDAERLFLDAWTVAPLERKDEISLHVSRAYKINSGERSDEAIRWIERVSDACSVQKHLCRLFYIHMQYRDSEPERVDAAIASAEAVLREHPDSPELLGVIAAACSWRGRSAEKARAYIQRAIAGAPDGLSVAFFAGWTFGELGEAEESERWFARTIELDPGFGPGYGNLALGCLGRGDLVEAVRHCEAGIRRDPFYGWNRLVLAHALIRLGRSTEAETALEGAIAIWGRDPQLHLLLGEVRERAGDRAGAWNAYRDVLRLDPGNEKVRRALERLSGTPEGSRG